MMDCNNSLKQFLLLLVSMAIIAVIFILITTISPDVSLNISDERSTVLPLGISYEMPTVMPLSISYEIPTVMSLNISPFSGGEKNKLVIPLSAYFDPRGYKTHENTTVILAEVEKSILKDGLIVGCQIDGVLNMETISVEPVPLTGWINYNIPKMTHLDTIISCYDMFASDGSEAAVIYKKEKESKSYLRAISERPVLLNKEIEKDSKESPGSGMDDDDLIMVCSTVYREPKNLDEWLRYQKTIGVDLVHLNAQESFLNQGAKHSLMLNESLQNGFVRMEVWPAYLGRKQIFYYSQSLMYQDCILRYQDLYDYAFMLDVDDYFVPVTPNKTNIHDYIGELFKKNRRWSKSEVGCVRFKWIEYYCPIKKMEECSHDGNLTNCIDTSKYEVLKNPKSIHKIRAVDQMDIHKVGRLRLHFDEKWFMESDKAYVAHIRPRQGRQCST